MSINDNSLTDRVINNIESSINHLGMKGKRIKFPSDIIVVGAGGTGSWFAPKLTKIINDAIMKGLLAYSNINVVYIDGDDIEEKNIIRQNFIKDDIANNKAEILSSRYGSQFINTVTCGFINKYIYNSDIKNINDQYRNKYVDIKNLELFKKKRSGKLIINLIDNAVTRKMIHLTAISVNAIVIDVANNEYNGQLVTSVYKETPEYDTSNAAFYNELSSHLEMNDDVSVFSCADADADSVDQLFNANDMAATILGNYLNDWIVRAKIYNGRIDFTTGSNISISRSNEFYDTNYMTLGFYGNPSDESERAIASFRDSEKVNGSDQSDDYIYEVSVSLADELRNMKDEYREAISRSM